MKGRKWAYEEGVDVGDGVEALLQVGPALLKWDDEILETGTLVDGLRFLLAREIA